MQLFKSTTKKLYGILEFNLARSTINIFVNYNVVQAGIYKLREGYSLRILEVTHRTDGL